MNALSPVALLGFTLWTLLALQVLIGLRIIHFKGPLHSKVHRWLAYALLILGAVHGAMGLGWLPWR